MDSKEIKLEVVTPSKDIGRCCICRTELATKVLTIERVQEIRFCDKCFNRFKDIININGADKNYYDKLLEEAKDQFKAYSDVIAGCRPAYRLGRNALIELPSDKQNTVDEAQRIWLNWVYENISSKNLRIHFNLDGTPVAISTTLAGCLG